MSELQHTAVSKVRVTVTAFAVMSCLRGLCLLLLVWIVVAVHAANLNLLVWFAAFRSTRNCYCYTEPLQSPTGAVLFGPTQDVSLFRTAAGTLKTSNSFEVSGRVRVRHDRMHSMSMSIVHCSGNITYGASQTNLQQAIGQLQQQVAVLNAQVAALSKPKLTGVCASIRSPASLYRDNIFLHCSDLWRWLRLPDHQ